MELPPSLVQAAHFTDMEVEDVASTAKTVGAAGANVCVMASKGSVDQTLSWLLEPTLLQENDTHFKLHEFVTELVEPSSV